MALTTYDEMVQGWAKYIEKGLCGFDEAIWIVSRRMNTAVGYVEEDMAKIIPFSLTNEQRVATLLHSTLCRISHTHLCSWYDETWAKPGTSRKYYIKQAQSVLTHATEDETRRVLEAIHGK